MHSSVHAMCREVMRLTSCQGQVHPSTDLAKRVSETIECAESSDVNIPLPETVRE